MLVVGFSTGALAYHDFERALALLEPTRANAVELSALRLVELPKLLGAMPSLIEQLQRRFRYISFHAPADFEDECGLVKQLMSIAEMGLNIVVHPDAIKEARPWQELGNRLCFENMDSRKRTGRTADELQYFFSHVPQAKLCFDIAHARQVDRTMTEAARILSRFGDRIAHGHLSELDGGGKHIAMSFAAKQAYRPFADILSKVPIILESVVREPEIATEIDKAEKLLRLSCPA